MDEKKREWACVFLKCVYACVRAFVECVCVCDRGTKKTKGRVGSSQVSWRERDAGCTRLSKIGSSALNQLNASSRKVKLIRESVHDFMALKYQNIC